MKEKNSTYPNLRHLMGEQRDRRVGILLTLAFSLVMFVVLFITIGITVSVLYFLLSRGILHFEESPGENFGVFLLLLAGISIVFGTLVSIVVGSVPLRPLQNMMNGLEHLSEGEYDTRLEEKGIPLYREIAKSFNKLAYELEHTEMLRSDFINNFSHEFKTPIASIKGFAKLLKRENLTEEQRTEYLDIIEEECERLSDLATNVLDLTKVENQQILTDVTEFNLSEQIRDCVLLVEKKWSQKNLTPALEFNEYQISANEDLLKQVWINLLDNTIKYSPEGETFEVRIRRNQDEKGETLTVSFKNYGPPISDEDLPLIMNKFYQADTSHASEGNGIGLAIVKRVVELHGGIVNIESNEESTVYSVTLPQ